MTTRLAIVGSGANGSCVAADLVAAGLDVALIDQWPEHVEAMRRGGLTVRMPDRELHVAVDAFHLCDVASFTGRFDVVLVMVKAYDTGWAARLIAPYLAADGVMAGLQNAMTAGEIAEVAGPGRSLGCVVELSAELFTPGVAVRNTPPERTWMALGALDPAGETKIAAVRDILANAAAVEISDDILSAKWMKLVVNCMGLGPVAMLGLPVGEAAKVPGFREFILKAGGEALAAGRRQGHRITPIFGLREQDIDRTNRLLETLFDKLVGDIGPTARDCVYQDHLKGRYSEVDRINGLVVDNSPPGGAPANQAVTEITRRIRSGALRPDPSNLPLALEMLSS